MKKLIAVSAVVLGLAFVGMGSTAEAGHVHYHPPRVHRGHVHPGHVHYHGRPVYRAPVVRRYPVYAPAYVAPAPYAPVYVPAYRRGVSIGVGIYPGY